MPSLKPLISVVLPVYNQARYLADSIQSVFAAHQKFPLELIVVDDGSTDNFTQVFQEFHDERLRLIRQPQNQGLAAALNTGFGHARGQLLSWTSADNLYEPQCLDILASFLEAQPTIGFVYGNVRLIDELGKPAMQSNYRQLDQAPQDSSVLLLPRCPEALPEWHDNFINACFLYRRSVYEQVGAFRSDLAGAEDFDYWLRVGLVSKLAHVGLAQPLYRYRLHDQSFTSRLETGKLAQLAESCARLAREEHQRRGTRDPLAILRRAREMNFHAVTAEASSEAVVALFCPDSTIEDQRLLELIGSQSATCFVLIARTVEQRSFADRTNQALHSAPNLRIIDLTQATELPELTSLMFVMSSIDGVISLTEPERSLEEIAQTAGRGLLAVLPQPPISALACPFIVAPDAASIRAAGFSQQFRQVIRSFRTTRANVLKELALPSE